MVIPVSAGDGQAANYIINVSRRQRPYVGVGVALESRASLAVAEVWLNSFDSHIWSAQSSPTT
jgi:hypothetical protein